EANGSWSEVRRIDAPGTPTSVAFGHFSGERTLLEMAVPSPNGIDIRDVRTGALDAAIPLAVDYMADLQLAAGDLHRAGAYDLIVDNIGAVLLPPPLPVRAEEYTDPRIESWVMTFLSTGHSFRLIDTYRAGEDRLITPVLGDFNGDGRLDLAVQRIGGDL